MSASSKKKLRSAENADKLTERQLQEQKEAKKLKTLTAVVVVLIGVALVFAIWTAVTRTIENSGIRERNTVAVTVGNHEISNAELNYFFVDAVNNFYSTYGDYAAMLGLDVTTALDEQYVDEEAGITWADDFMTSAIENAKAVYALTDEANAQGYTMSVEEEFSVEQTMTYMDMYAPLYGYSNTEDYVKAIYGNGATIETLKDYFMLTTLAASYQNHHSETLTYTDEELRSAEAENHSLYSSFSYNYYYLSTSKFLEGGTTNEDGSVTYSDEENAAAVAAAEAAAVELTSGTYASTEEFDAAIAALTINADVENAASTAYTNNSYSGISSLYADWMTDESRVAGDMTYVANTTHSHAEGETHSDDEDASEHETVNGYYVVYFVDASDNNLALKNVRHILAGFEGGTTDSTTGLTTYTDEEKAAAKQEADELMAEWTAGEATEESFAALANEKSDDGDGTTGGLYEDVYPGQMVSAFNDWCFDEARKPGDTEIVETEYGYHIMYFVGDSETNYRDYLITNDLRDAEMTEWYNTMVEAMTVTEGNTKYITTDLVLSAS